MASGTEEVSFLGVSAVLVPSWFLWSSSVPNFSPFCTDFESESLEALMTPWQGKTWVFSFEEETSVR